MNDQVNGQMATSAPGNGGERTSQDDTSEAVVVETVVEVAS